MPNDNTWLVVLVLVIGILLLFKGGYIHLNNFSSYENNETNTEYVKVNLCNVMQPYIIPSDIANQCVLYGGDWSCTSTFVGCVDLPVAIVDCSGPAIYISTYQCQAMGGTAVCNPTNVYCAYT